MIPKQKDIDIDNQNPFKNCKLNRKKYADVLTQLVASSPEGFVMSINNKWGTGKTTFVKMWKQSLVNKGYKTIYFNAWENDFEDNALIALMGELKTVTDLSTVKKFNSVLKKGSVIAKNIIPIVTASLAKRYLDMEKVDGLLEGVSSMASELFENEVNEYADKKKGIKDFRIELTKFISESNQGKPIIFIIDELDRCRPNYAVSILEQIKHFFSVKGITFVLAIDKEQLGHAVCGVYGNHNIDAPEYLRRFIDFEYSIPEPSNSIFIEHLFEIYNFDNIIQSQYHRSLFRRTIKLFASSNNLSLRQHEKIFLHLNLIIKGYFRERVDSPEIIYFLLYIRMVDYNFYIKIQLKKYSLEDILTEFKNLFEKMFIRENNEILVNIEAKVLYFYNAYKYSRESNRLFGENDTLLIDSLLSNSREDFQMLLYTLKKSENFDGTLEKSFEYIEMLDTIIFDE